MDPSQFPELLIWYVIFLFTVTLHEASHALAAKLGGDLTAYHGGQVSLDPLPHIRREPFGMVVFPIIALLFMGWPFGFASTPVDLLWMRRHPRRAALMALSGPASHVILLGVALGLFWAGRVGGVFQPPAAISSLSDLIAPTAEDSALWSGLAGILSMFLFLNLVLFLFNLIPFPPLDGGSAVLLFMNEETAAKYLAFTSQPMVSIIGILLAWRIFGTVFGRVFPFFLRLMYPEMVFA